MGVSAERHASGQYGANNWPIQSGWNTTERIGKAVSSRQGPGYWLWWWFGRDTLAEVFRKNRLYNKGVSMPALFSRPEWRPASK